MDTLKIVMKSCSAGPGGTLESGKTYQLPRARANELIAGGYASLVGVGTAQPAAAPKAVETATAPRPAENAGGAAPTVPIKEKAKDKSKGGKNASPIPGGRGGKE